MQIGVYKFYQHHHFFVTFALPGMYEKGESIFNHINYGLTLYGHGQSLVLHK
jgi:hypothetical protein